jgi:hypothetical protein
MNRLVWAVETVGLYSLEEPGARDDYILIPVDRIPKEDRWEVKVRRLEAVLSLWMATIEAQSKDAKQVKVSSGKTNNSPAQPSETLDLRRTKGRYTFCRILGDDSTDDNSTLKRDLSWWVGERIAEQSDDPVRENESSTKSNSNTIEPVADTTSNPTTWHRSKACKDVELIIGFNGPEAECERSLLMKNIRSDFLRAFSGSQI